MRPRIRLGRAHDGCGVFARSRAARVFREGAENGTRRRVRSPGCGTGNHGPALTGTYEVQSGRHGEGLHELPSLAISAREPGRTPLTPSLSPPPRRGEGVGRGNTPQPPSLSPPPGRGEGARRAGEGWLGDDRFMGREVGWGVLSVPVSAGQWCQRVRGSATAG